MNTLTILLTSLILGYSFQEGGAGLAGNPELEELLNCNATVEAGPDQTICDPTTITLNGEVNPSDPLSVSWTPVTGLTSPNSLNTSAFVSQTTTYTLTATVTSDQNLVFNGNFDAGLTGFTSDYIPGSGGAFGLLSQEGQFAVATNASQTHTNFASCTDHTGGGNMLVVNGASVANQEVWCQVVSVTPNTEYAFSAWVTSVVSSSPAQLQFSVNGQLLGGIFTAPTATCVWSNFFQIWNAGNNSSVEICIVNQNTAVSGNDFALDDLYFGEVCEFTDQVTITLQQVDASWTPPTGLCPFSPGFNLNTLLDPGATPGGSWTVNGVNASFFNPLTLGPGAHTVTYTVGTPPCTEVNTQFIIVETLPQADWNIPFSPCESTPALDLNLFLNPGTDPTGTWTINSLPATVLDPAFWGPGPHFLVYTVGTPPCINQQSGYIDILPSPDVNWTPPLPLCDNAAPVDPDDWLAPGATTGGNWTLNGNTIQVFDPQQLGPGNFTLTYTAGDPSCSEQLSQSVSVIPTPVAGWSSPGFYCTGTPAFPLNDLLDLGATLSGDWTINGMLAGTFDPGALGPGLWTVTYTADNGSCTTLHTETIQIGENPVAAFEVSTDTVCVNETLDINYTGTDIPGLAFFWTVEGQPAPPDTPRQFTVSWPAPGAYEVSLWVADGDCTSDTVSHLVTVLAPPDPPVPVCGPATNNTVSISWASVPDAAGYSVQIVPGPVESVADTMLTISGLLPGEEVAVIVYAQGEDPCPAVASDTLYCMTQSCEPVPLAIQPVDPLCFADSLTTIDLEATIDDPTGSGSGYWSGPGMVDTLTGLFDPLAAGAGEHLITFQYDLNNCLSLDSLFILISEPPVAAFVLPEAVCAGDPATIGFSGAATADAAFNWDFGGGQLLSTTATGLSLVSWPEAGNYTVTLEVSDSLCTSGTVSDSIQVNAPPALPEISCRTTESSIEFFWPADSLVSDYQVTVLNGLTGVMTSDTSFLVDNLAPLQEVGIELALQVPGPCPDLTASRTCIASDCPDLPVVITMPAPVCLTVDAMPFALEATVADTMPAGIFQWEGPGITDPLNGIFDPAVAGAGLHVVQLTLTQGSCSYVANTTVDVRSVPVAAFDLPGQICLTDTATVVFTGAAPAGATYSWDFGQGTIIAGAAAGPYRVQWPSAGSHEVTLQVEAVGCTSEEVTQTIQIDPLLDTLEVNCTSTYTTVEFSWLEDTAVDSYTVTVLDGPAGMNNTPNSFLFTGLEPGEEATIRLTATSGNACPDLVEELTCAAQLCPDVTLSVDAVPAVCLTEDPDTLSLSYEVSPDNLPGSFSWQGPGIVDTLLGLWCPMPAMAGSEVSIILTYRDDVCVFTDTLPIAVFETPVADFTADTLICETGQAEVLFTGSAPAGATYYWQFGQADADPGTGPGPHLLSWPNAGADTLQLWLEADGCLSDTASQVIQVDALPVPPPVSCQAGFDNIQFSWSADTQLTPAGFVVLNGPDGTAASDTSYLITGLVPGQSVDLQIDWLSGNACPDTTTVVSCQTPLCPDISVDILPVDTICWDGSPDTLQLIAELAGNGPDGVLTWSGPGIADSTAGIWMSDGQWTGQNIQVEAFYREAACEYRDSLSIVIRSQPSSEFSLDSVICMTDAATATFEGATAAGAVFLWNFDGATAIPGDGAGPHQLTWDTPGDYLLSLTVTNESCTSEPTSRTIRVDAQLVTPQVQCQADYTSIDISWPALTGAGSYEVTTQPMINGEWVADTLYRLTGLAPGTAIEFTVTALGETVCGPVSQALSCQTEPCPELTVLLEGPEIICAGDVAELIFTGTAAGAPYRLTLNDGNQDLVFDDLNDGSGIGLAPAGTQVYEVVAIESTTLPFCTVTAPAGYPVTVQMPESAGLPLDGPAVCNDRDTVFQLSDLLSGSSPGGIWTELTALPSAGGAFEAAAGTFNPQGQAGGSYVFQYRVDGPPPCPADSAMVAVMVHPTPVADAGEDQALNCLVNVVSLGGSGTSDWPGLVYQWTSAGDALIDNADLPLIDVSQVDTYTLSVTDPVTGCSATDEVGVISDVAFLDAAVAVQPISCFGEADGVITVENIAGGTPPYSYALNDGAFSAQTIFTGLAPGTYQVHVRDSRDCFTDIAVTLAQPAELDIELFSDLDPELPILDLGDSLSLWAQVSVPEETVDRLVWSPDTLLCQDCYQQRLSITDEMIFAVTVMDTNGCTASDQLRVFVRKDHRVFIPNVFSPNGDGYNDVLMIFAGPEARIVNDFQVFNRWGETVFSVRGFLPNDPDFGWDGTFRGRLMNPAVFVYLAEIEMADGTVVLFQGDVTLVR